MGDTAMTVVAILLAAILMFVFPLMTMADKNDDVTNLEVQQSTTDFTDTIRTTAKLTQDDYDNFVLTLASTGNAYNVEIVVQRLDENLSKKDYSASVTIGDNVYYTEYTSQILDELGQNGVTYFQEGDMVSVTVESSSTTIAQQLRNVWYKLTGSDLDAAIAAYSTGMVTKDGI